MAVNKNSQSAPTDQLNKPFARLAAAVSILLGLLGVAGVLVYVLTHTAQPAGSTLMHVAWLILFALVVIAGTNLLRGCTMSHRLLLVFWLVTGLLAALTGLSTLLWAEPAWWKTFLELPLAAVVLPVLVLAGVATTLLVLASAARLRYASMVIVSIAAAVLLVVVANLIAQKDYYRKDIETLGRYGLSDRTKRILQDIHDPVQLTVIYTSTDEKRKGADFRPQVLELTGEMKQALARQGVQMNIVNVTTDAERAALRERLRTEVVGSAQKQDKFINDFLAQADSLIKAIKDEADKSPLKDNAYLNAWGLGPGLTMNLEQTAEDLQKLKADISQQYAGGMVPDVTQMAKQVQTSLAAVRDDLNKAGLMIKEIAKVPAMVQPHKDAAAAAVKKSAEALDQLTKAIGKPDDAAPKDPAATLKEIIAAMRKVADAFTASAMPLEDISKADNLGILRANQQWASRSLDYATRSVVMKDPAEMQTEFGEQMKDNAEGLEAQLPKRTSEGQLSIIQSLRQEAESLASVASRQQKFLAALQSLSSPDEATRKIFTQAADAKLFPALQAPIDALIGQTADFTESKPSSLNEELSRDNVILVGIAGRTEAVPFDSVWPLRSQQGPAKDSADARVFNGDSAIASKLLTMTQKKPFGTVYLTYATMSAGPQDRPPMPQDGLAPWEVIASRLREANFEVKEWNLNDPFPDAEPTTASAPASGPATATAPAGSSKPRILVVLPVPPQSKVTQNPNIPLPPGFYMPEHAEKLRKEINAGASALFLAGFGLQEMNAVMEYLRKDWGVNVQSDRLIIAADRDEQDPRRLNLNWNVLSHMALNDFSDKSPIGKSLRSQRVLWQGVCPITKDESAKPPRSVTYEPILSVTADTMWAVDETHLRQLGEQFMSGQGNSLPVAFEPGDVRPPFDVAVQASCAKAQGIADNRIVVLASGASLTDRYLQSRWTPKPNQLADPPTSNADFVVNSAYWLIGKHDYIAAGPAQIRPVSVSQAQLHVIWPLMLAGLPALVLAAWGVVSTLRRR